MIRYRGAMKLIVVCSLVLLTLAISANGGIPKCIDVPVQEGHYAGDSRVSGPNLTVVSLNMAKERHPDSILRDLQESTLLDVADVWILQEATPTVAEIARALQLDYVYAPSDVLNGGTLSGLAILSRYPINSPTTTRLPQYNLRFNTRCRAALSASIESPSGPMHLVNLHLDTRITEEQRLKQVTPVVEAQASALTPVIIGGDFNTANIRWVWNVVPIPYVQDHARAVRDLFTTHGFESPLDGVRATFKLLALP